MDNIKKVISDPATAVIVFLTVALVQVLVFYYPQIQPIQYYVSCGAALVITALVWVFGLKKEGSFLDLIWAVLLALPVNLAGNVLVTYLNK